MLPMVPSMAGYLYRDIQLLLIALWVLAMAFCQLVPPTVTGYPISVDGQFLPYFRLLIWRRFTSGDDR